VEGTDPGGTVRGRRRREARGPATAKGQEDSIGVGEGGDAKVIRVSAKEVEKGSSSAPRGDGKGLTNTAPSQPRSELAPPCSDAFFIVGFSRDRRLAQRNQASHTPLLSPSTHTPP
jgi:hypothetical protein